MSSHERSMARLNKGHRERFHRPGAQILVCLAITCGFLVLGSMLPLEDGLAQAERKTRDTRTAPASSQVEVRGAWLRHYDFATQERREQLLRNLLDANLNTVFIPCFPLNGNYGWSEKEGVEAFLPMLKEHGISAHLWVANYYRLPGGVDFRYNDEWEVQAQWAMDWLNTYPDLDGVHFDYIRFVEVPEGEVRMTQEKMEAVSKTVRTTYEAIKDKYPHKFLSAAVFTSQNLWGYVDMTTLYVPQWFLDWKAANPGNAYETPSPSPNLTFMPFFFSAPQNPPVWVAEGYIDAILPMQYTHDDSIWDQELEAYKSFLEFFGHDTRRLIMTLGWEEERGLDPAHIVRKIKAGRAKGIRGFVIFVLGESGVDDRPLVEALATDGPANEWDAPFEVPARSWLSSDPVFIDVPHVHPYHDEIEALYQAGYTAGCSTNPLRYCPDATMNRAESAVFVERGIHGTDGLPRQPTTQTFADLPLDSWAAKWAEALWQDHYTAGCGTDPLVYCPWQGHTRAEGCVFFLHMLNGATYEPPQPSQQTFSDVPLDTWYAKWVQAGYDAGLLTPCQTSPELRFCPNDPLTRALAAHMMVQAKRLN